MSEMIQRRKLLQRGLFWGGIAAVIPAIASAAEQCLETPRQAAGPFYPGETQFTATHDLTVLPNAKARALGEIVYLIGQVTGASCEPLANVNVEIWQACASGRYNNPRDPNTAPLDPNFRYWGEAFTDKDGKFYFKTVKPGAYPASEDWRRPPHIHVRVSKLGFRELVTQLYFAGDLLNDADLILRDTPADQRGQLVLPFKEGIGPDGDAGLVGEAVLSLLPVRAR